jgi:hypothetical protein
MVWGNRGESIIAVANPKLSMTMDQGRFDIREWLLTVLVSNCMVLPMNAMSKM